MTCPDGTRLTRELEAAQAAHEQTLDQLAAVSSALSRQIRVNQELRSYVRQLQRRYDDLRLRRAAPCHNDLRVFVGGVEITPSGTIDRADECCGDPGDCCGCRNGAA